MLAKTLDQKIRTLLDALAAFNEIDFLSADRDQLIDLSNAAFHVTGSAEAELERRCAVYVSVDAVELH